MGNEEKGLDDVLDRPDSEGVPTAGDDDEMVIQRGSASEVISEEEEKEEGDNAEPEMADHLEDEHRLSFLLRQDKRFLYMAIIVIIFAVIGFGYLMRVQNLDFATMSESLASLSDLVEDLSRNRQAEVVPTGTRVVREVNEASVYCQESGGQLAVAKRPDGLEYALCLFGPNRQCAEEALYKGRCPVGGVDITRYSHPADVYCVITGNVIDPALIPGRPGKCTVGDQTCSAEDFYETGQCLGK